MLKGGGAAGGECVSIFRISTIPLRFTLYNRVHAKCVGLTGREKLDLNKCRSADSMLDRSMSSLFIKESIVAILCCLCLA